MNRNLRKVFLGVVFLVFVFAAFGLQSATDHKLLFEKAKYTMETKGDLEEAIKLFNEIIGKFPGEREYAAKSQFLIGECYEKLGRSGAIKAYERVVTDYTDQTDLVSAARSRLTTLQAQKSDMVKATQLSTGDFYLEGGTLSPDGTQMVGVSFEIGQNIAVMNVGENKVTQITRFEDGDREGGWTHQPVWSPDGTEIAFMFGDWFDKKPGELRTTTLEGKQRSLYVCAKEESIYPQQWLPTGDAILCGLHTSDGFVLGLVSVRDGTFRALRKFSEEISGSASPNGRYIVFFEGEVGSRSLSIISADGKSHKPLTEGPTDDKQPLWSPDGRHIVFLSHRHGGWALWGIEVDGKGDPIGPPFLIRDGMQNADLRNWTKSGVYYQNWIDATDVFVSSIDPQSGSLTEGLKQIDYTPTGNNKRPVWSPDGKFLAFASSSEDYPGQAYVVVRPADGGETKRFPFPTQNYSAPWFHNMRWRPDNKAIGLLTNNDEGKIAFFVVDLTTGKWTSKTLSEAYDRRTRVEWKGDGNAIYLAQIGLADKNPGIVEHNIETGQERYIYRSKYPEDHIFRDLTCSRDYSKLAILEGGKNLVIVETGTGKTLREFSTNERMRLSSLAWSPDGDRLFGLNQVPESRNIKSYSIVSMEDGTEKTFEYKGGLPKRFTYSDWSPDGTRMAFSTRAMKYEIFLLSNIIPKNR